MKGKAIIGGALILCLGADCLAEERSIPGQIRPEALTPQQIQSLARQFDVPIDSPFIRAIKGGEFIDEIDPGIFEKKVFFRVRGTGGAPLPSKEATLVKLRSWAEGVNQDLKIGDPPPYDPKNAQAPKGKMFMQQADPLPPCPRSGAREKIGLRQTPSGSKEVEKDLLIVATDQPLPQDISATLGKKAIITRYNAVRPDGPTLAASSLPLRCLPTRFRVSADFVFKDEGDAAFRNYDSDPEGEGTLHPEMEKLLRK